VNSSTPTHTISVAPYSVNFGTQATSTLSRQTVTIANAGTKTIQITSVSLSGSSVYALGGWTGPVNLAPSQQLSLTISFQPTAATSYSGMLTVNGTGTADASVAISGSGSGSSLTSAPSAPSNLQAAAANAQASLSWATSSGAASYNVKRSTTNGGPYTTIASALTASYSDASVSNGTMYYYVVSAVNSSGESGNSNQASAMPQAPATVPSAPTGLQAAPGNAQASLSWSASSGASSYNVKRATTSGGPYTTIASATTTSYTNSSLTNGTTYYYVVSAVNSAGESANSSQVSATPSAPVSSGVSISVTSYGAIGNGVADDTASINSAISALQSGYTLSFPCGTYLVSGALHTITLSNVTIAGTPGCTTIKASRSFSTMWQLGNNSQSGQTGLSAVASELSTSFTANLGNIGGVSAGDFVILQEGGRDYSTDSSPGHDTNCDVSGCRGEVLQISNVSGSTATVSSALHYTYDPNVNAANVKKINNPVTGVTMRDIVLDGAGAVSTGLYISGLVNSTLTNVTAQHVTGWGMATYWSYNIAYNNVSVKYAGNGSNDAFQLWGLGKANINGMTISNLNSNGFGFGLSTVADSTFTNVTVDATGTSGGRPTKLLAASYNTFNNLTVKNGAGGDNGISIEYYSSHNTVNTCSVTGNSANGIDGFGNYNSYNKFVNCTVSGNTGWQVGQTASALGQFNDNYWEISGGSYTGANSNNVLQINGGHFYVHNANVVGPGDNGIVVNGNYGCINSNSFGGSFNYNSIYFSGSGSVANGNSTVGAVYPNPLPTGTCQ
jgi:hypothetical protein